MLKKFLISVVVILFLSSGVFADIGQVQGFEVGALNKVKVVGGFGLAVGRNMLEIGQSQTSRKPRFGRAAMKQGGILTQHARARAKGGAVGVIQNASVDGSQNQLISRGHKGHGGPQAQGQNLNLDFNTIARKPRGGIGRVIGSQSFVGGQSQKQATHGRFSTSSQFVQVQQGVKIVGGRCSNVVVKNNLDVSMFQGDTPR